MNISDYKKFSGFLKALSHPTRLMIVIELLKGERCVSDIRDLLKMKQPNISQHLTILKANGIVDWIQQGQRKCYFLKNPNLIKNIVKELEKSKSKI